MYDECYADYPSRHGFSCMINDMLLSRGDFACMIMLGIYRKRLQELAESMQQMQTTHFERENALQQQQVMQQQHYATHERSFASRSSRRSKSPQGRSRGTSPHVPHNEPSVVEPNLPKPPPQKIRIPE